MMKGSSQHILDNRKFFAFLSGEQMGIAHGHGDVLVTHELLQLHERDLAGLRQPGGEGMPHGMQSDGVQAVAVFRGQPKFFDGGLEAGGRLGERRLLPGLLEDGFDRLASVCLKHPDHIFRHPDENTLAPFLDDIETTGVGVHILSAQFEYLRGAKAGSQREQNHVMQLRMPLFKVIQKSPCFLSGQETQPFVVGFDHCPCAASGGQRIDAAPHAGGNSAVYGGAHERKDIVHGLPGQSFPLLHASFGLSCGCFGFCITGGCFQELRLEAGKQIGGQFDHGQAMNFGLDVRRVLTIMLVNVLSLAVTPFAIGVHHLPNGHFVALDRIDAGGCHFGEEFCALLFDGRWPDALAMPADGFPVPLAFKIGEPEGINSVGGAGTRIAFGREAIVHALELGLDVFSAGYVAHGENVPAKTCLGKMFIQNLSKTDSSDKNFSHNTMYLLIIFVYIHITCERERERERLGGRTSHG